MRRFELKSGEFVFRSEVKFFFEKIITKFGNGARILEVLLSTIETLKLQGKNPIEGMKNIVQTSCG